MCIHALRTRRVALAAAAILVVAIQFIRPARTNPSSDPNLTLTAHVDIPPDVAAIVKRSCGDCHSNETRWPWYSNVAPVSWWVIDHVNHGRSHFNFSEWAKYNPEEQRKLLKESCALAREGKMPLASYLLMHDASLDAQELQLLCDWSAVARR